MALSKGERALMLKLKGEGVKKEEARSILIKVRQRAFETTPEAIEKEKKKEKLRGVQEAAEQASETAREAGKPTFLGRLGEAVAPAGEAIKSGAEKITGSLTQPGDVGDSSDIVLRTIRKARDVAAGVGEIVGGAVVAPLAAAEEVIPTEKTKESLKSLVPDLAPIGELIGQTSSQVVNDIAEGTGLSPEQIKGAFMAGLGDLFKSSEALGVIAGAPGAVKAAKTVARETVPALETAGVGLLDVGEKAIETGVDIAKGVKKGAKAVSEVPEKVVGAVEKRLTREGREGIAKAKRLEKFEEIAQPVLTAREKSRAFKKGTLLTERRGIIGKKVKLLDGRKNKVAKTLESEFGKDFIFNNIGDAGRQLNGKIKKVATELKPSLKSQKITKKQVGNLEKFAKEIGELHKDSPHLNVLTPRQIDAQNRLLEEAFRKTDIKNLDDLWEVRKNYDNSVSDNVKKIDLQTDTGTPAGDKKRVWLENRELLNDTLEGMSVGLEKEAKQSFDIMSDLYEAQNAMATFASKEKNKPGLLKKLAIGTAGLTGTFGGGFLLNEVLSD